MKCKVLLCMGLLLTISTGSESLKILKKIKDFLHPTTTVRPEQHQVEKKNDDWRGDEDSAENSNSDSHSSESSSHSSNNIGDGYNTGVRTTARPPYLSGTGGSQNVGGASGGSEFESATRKSDPMRPDHPFDVDDNSESQWGGATSPAGAGQGSGHSSGNNNRQSTTQKQPSFGQDAEHDLGALKPTGNTSYNDGMATTDKQSVQSQDDNYFGQSTGSTSISGSDGTQSTYGDGHSSAGRPLSNENSDSAGSQKSYNNGQSSPKGPTYGQSPSGGFQPTGYQTSYNNGQTTPGGSQPGFGSQSNERELNGNRDQSKKVSDSPYSLPQSTTDRQFGVSQKIDRDGPATNHDSREGSLVFPDHPSLNPTPEPARSFEHRPGSKHSCGPSAGAHRGCEESTDAHRPYGSGHDSTPAPTPSDGGSSPAGSTTADPRGGKSQGHVPVDDGRRVFDVPPRQCPDGQKLDPNGYCRTPARK